MNLEEAFVLLETDILLNDFFHRYPELAPNRKVEESKLEALRKWRADIHQTLLRLSEVKGIKVAITQASLLRMASLFAEYFVPPTISRSEVLYLLNNYIVLETKALHIEKALQKHLELFPAQQNEEQAFSNEGASLHQLILAEIAIDFQIGYILSAANQIGDYLLTVQQGKEQSIVLLHPAQVLALPMV